MCLCMLFVFLVCAMLSGLGVDECLVYVCVCVCLKGVCALFRV